MNHWLETSKRNLIPLSIAGSFEDALSEWIFTGNVLSYEDDEEVQCQLCEHLDLAYHFEINNKLNNKTLLVGSSCILRFDRILVSDKNGNALYAYEQRKSRLDEARKDQIREQTLEPLRLLWRHVKQDENLAAHIERNAKLLKKEGSLPPADLLSVFKEMKMRGINYQAHLYKVNLRVYYEVLKLEKMSPDDLRLIKGAFSTQQLKRYQSLFETKRDGNSPRK
ncbi:MAG: hypothetical protein K0S46_2181 [Moraxellaceae bacterium]|jgi:hypothetical protein|nr:hypothetical protein [Moraxellaceae bacterium]